MPYAYGYGGLEHTKKSQLLALLMVASWIGSVQWDTFPSQCHFHLFAPSPSGLQRLLQYRLSMCTSSFGGVLTFLFFLFFEFSVFFLFVFYCHLLVLRAKYIDLVVH